MLRALDYDTQLTLTAETDNFKTCELLDGNIITVGAEDFHCTEVLFQPNSLGEGASGDEVRH